MNACVSALALRSASAEDVSFFCSLYGSGRADEMASWGWTGEQRKQFVNMQFTAREQHYAAAYPEREDLLLLRDERPVGRMIVARRMGEIVLVDIALIQEEQGRGAGAALLADLQGEATESAKPLRLHVLGSNTGAIRFYERLGFKIIDDDGSYLHLEWRPSNLED